MSASAALRRRPTMTLEEFLAWEERQEERWEFDGFAPVAMTGGTRAHSALGTALAAALVPRLRGGPCRYYGGDLKFVTASGTSRCPDGFVACGPGGPRDTLERDPVAVFEVLSASTARVDRTVKAREYRETPSLRRYVMLEQGAVAATVHARDADGRWTAALLFAGDALDLPEVGVSLPLAELYQDLDLAGPGAGPWEEREGDA